MRQQRKQIRFLAVAALLTSLLAILSPWTVPIGPVGITLATFALLTVALFAPWQLALTATTVYLSLGAIGLPIFSQFTSGITQLASPNGGFLIGYLPFVMIASLTRYAKKPLIKLLILTFAHIALYAVGGTVFALTLHLSFREALTLSVLPFLLPDAIKAVLAYYTASLLKKRLPKL